MTTLATPSKRVLFFSVNPNCVWKFTKKADYIIEMICAEYSTFVSLLAACYSCHALLNRGLLLQETFL